MNKDDRQLIDDRQVEEGRGRKGKREGPASLGVVRWKKRNKDDFFFLGTSKCPLLLYLFQYGHHTNLP